MLTKRELISSALVVVSIAVILLLEIVKDSNLLLLYVIDFGISLALLYDYVLRVKENGKKYLISTCYEVIAYIPAVILSLFVPVYYGAVLRLLRILRLLALGLRLMREIQSRSTRLLGTALAIFFITVFLGALSFYFAEKDVQNLDFFNSVWWAVVTITTVGYGDIYPVTPLGKLIAMVIVLMGVAVVSLFTASVLSVVMTEKERNLKKDLETLLKKYEETKDERERELLAKISELLYNDDYVKSKKN
ncbi:MAG: potassium channel family protein [Archaeoglobaceae archaeon]